MNFQNVVAEYFSRFPRLERVYRDNFSYMLDDGPAQYLVFGSILIPALASALAANDLETIVPICNFLEEASAASRADENLRVLIEIEVGKWLSWTVNEDRIAPLLGSETRRVCNYFEGLASQRHRLAT